MMHEHGVAVQLERDSDDIDRVWVGVMHDHDDDSLDHFHGAFPPDEMRVALQRQADIFRSLTPTEMFNLEEVR